jgi:hypothetical protein
MFFLLLLNLSIAHAIDPNRASITYGLNPKNRLDEITLNKLEADVSRDKDGRPVIEIQGKFKNRDSTLYWNSQKILTPVEHERPLKKGEFDIQEFSLEVPLTGQKTMITLTTSDLLGRRREEVLEVIFWSYPHYFSKE